MNSCTVAILFLPTSLLTIWKFDSHTPHALKKLWNIHIVTSRYCDSSQEPISKVPDHWNSPLSLSRGGDDQHTKFEIFPLLLTVWKYRKRRNLIVPFYSQLVRETRIYSLQDNCIEFFRISNILSNVNYSVNLTMSLYKDIMLIPTNDLWVTKINKIILAKDDFTCFEKET